MLDRVRREAGSGARGRHRIYLGIAPGVGKTYTALEELHRRKAARHRRRHRFPRDPRSAEDGRAGRRPGGRARASRSRTGASTVEEMDTDAIIARHRRSRWSTSWPIPTRPARSTRSAGRTSRICSPPASPSSAPSISSTWRAWPTSSRTSPASASTSGVPDRVIDDGRRGRADRHGAARAAPAHAPRQHLPAGARRTGAGRRSSARAT